MERFFIGISENNIITTELPAEEAPKGRLIDLDLAKELDSMPGGARHRTGTMQFMAIEVLEGKGHTYRHDLESFFTSSYGCAFDMATKVRAGKNQTR
jgi:serine/threonine protein kinase